MVSGKTPWRRFLDRPNDDRLKVFGIAGIVAFCCALVVTTASVLLRPYQDAHLEAERAARMAQMLDRLPQMRDVLAETGADALETRFVDLSAGTFTDAVDAGTYDATAAAQDPDLGVDIPSTLDIAGLKRRASIVPIYLIERDGDLLLVILPVRGIGYQSTIEAMLVLEADLRTIAALTITEQGETPGLGARIEEEDWQALWPGKEITDDDGRLMITVVRGTGSGPHEVDGITGATRTSSGVGDILRYWLGDHGYGPFLDQLRQEGL